MTTTPDTAGPPAQPPPVARLRGPQELAAALPHLCGFVPTESLVVVALHGPRHRVGLTLRVDLPPVAHEESLAAEVAQAVGRTGAGQALVLVCTGLADDHDLPRAGLVRRVRRRLRAAGVGADEALLVRDGRWASYLCRSERCCPTGGTSLAPADRSEALSLVAVDAVARGVAVLSSRDELVARVAAPAPATETQRALATADARRRERVRTVGRGSAGRAALGLWRQALAAAPDAPPAPERCADLVRALDDVVVRDEVLTSVLDDADALLGLLLTLAAWTPPPDDAQVCALLAWAAHVRGDGALANVALDRALTSEPGCTLAQLSRQALVAQLPPAEVREVLAGSRQALRAAHPWTRP